MIDNNKTYDLKTDPQKLIENPILAEYWKTMVRNVDGTFSYGLAEYLGLTFRLKNGKIKLQGSLHKYRNLGKHNYDDFSVVDVAEVVHELERNFRIDIYSTVLNNVEFGVNVVLPFGVHVVLDNLITYKGKSFDRKVEKGMSFYECRMSKFTIKIYDKGKQYNLPDNVLRFEIKVTAMQYLETKGIKLRYLSDLLNMDIYEPLGNILTEVFEEILFGDNTINESNLTTKERETYLRGSNPRAWKPQIGEKERKRLQRLEYEFKGILERHRTGVNFRSVVSDLIRVKSLELSQISQNSKGEYDVLIFSLFPFSPEINDRGKGRFVSNINISHNRYLGQCTNTKIKKCSGCGKPIERDKTYHSEECRDRKLERNARSNPKNNFRGQFKRVIEKPSLFDVVDLVKLSEEQNNWINRKLEKNYSNKKS
jgi:hypothetical protein